MFLWEFLSFSFFPFEPNVEGGDTKKNEDNEGNEEKAVREIDM